MPRGIAIKLTTWVGLWLALTTSAFAQQAEFISAYEWTSGDENHGGFSGIEVAADGRGFLAISDRAHVAVGTLERRGDRVSGVVDYSLKALPRGRDLSRLWGYQDSEGLAVSPNGEVFVSFEGSHLVVQYRDFIAFGHEFPRTEEFDGLEGNGSLEALAVDRDGILYTIPERSGSLSRPFPVFRFDGERWGHFALVARRDGFLVVGADIGPDNRFYILERRFDGPWGFASRIRSFAMATNGLADERVNLVTQTGTHDNLEGLSVWMDQTGHLRFTMISDNNFRGFQRTEIVEYRLKP